MKFPGKTLLLAAAVAAGFSTQALRADDAPPPPPAHKGHHGMPTPQERVDHMTQALTLTADQQQKILAVLQDEQTGMKAIWTNDSLDRDQKRDQMKALRNSTRDKIHAILTPDQVAKFKEMMKAGHGKGGPM